MPKKLELKLSRCIDDAFADPNAEAELAGKSSLELADASVTMIYMVCIFLSNFICEFWLNFVCWFTSIALYVSDFI
jgi:hypothetical protein